MACEGKELRSQTADNEATRNQPLQDPTSTPVSRDKRVRLEIIRSYLVSGQNLEAGGPVGWELEGQKQHHLNGRQKHTLTTLSCECLLLAKPRSQLGDTAI